MRTFEDYCFMAQSYPKAFKKAGVTAWKLEDLQKHFTITEKWTRYNGRKVMASGQRIISADNLANTITYCAKERVYKSYTCAGYIMTKLISHDWSGGPERIVYEYQYQYNG